MRKLVFNLLLTTMMGALFIACEGPEGAVGPAGPAGAQGPKGDKGDKGDPGEGEGLTALSFTTGVIEDVTDGINVLTLADLEPGEAEELENSFTPMVYVKSQGVWWPMPGMVGFGAGAVSTYTFVHGVEDNTYFIELFLTGYSENSEAIPARKFEDVRLVLIPTAALQGARVDLANYEDVISVFGSSLKSASRSNSLLSRK